MPLIERIAAELGALVSVDTYKPAVARGGDRRRGARSSTTSAVCATPSSRTSAPRRGAALVADAHARRAHANACQDPELYEDVVGRGAARSSRARVELALRRGVAREQLIVDPGPDFAKTPRADDRAARAGGAACTSWAARC